MASNLAGSNGPPFYCVAVMVPWNGAFAAVACLVPWRTLRQRSVHVYPLPRLAYRFEFLLGVILLLSFLSKVSLDVQIQRRLPAFGLCVCFFLFSWGPPFFIVCLVFRCFIFWFAPNFINFPPIHVSLFVFWSPKNRPKFVSKTTTFHFSFLLQIRNRHGKLLCEDHFYLKAVYY